MRTKTSADWSRWTPWAGTVGRLVLATVWAVAAVPKALDPVGTANSVRAYQLLPDAAAATFGYALPWVELALAALLAAGVAVRLASAVTVAMMLMFITGVSLAWARGLSIDCGCFGTSDTSPVAAAWTYLEVIVRDLALIAAAAWLVRRPLTRLALADRASTAPTHEETP